MDKRQDVIKKFNNILFHDGTLNKFEIKRIHNGKRKASFEIRFYLKLATKDFKNTYEAVLEFKNPVNIEMDIDFDILINNDFAPICGAHAEEWKYINKSIVQRNKEHWNITYSDRENGEKQINETPAKDKILHEEKYILFKLELFGGNISILAKSFKLRKVMI